MSNENMIALEKLAEIRKKCKRYTEISHKYNTIVLMIDEIERLTSYTIIELIDEIKRLAIRTDKATMSKSTCKSL